MSKSTAAKGVGTAIEGALVLWTIYTSFQPFRQARLNAAAAITTLLQPLWLYRLKKHDGTAFTDALLFSGLHLSVNGFPASYDVIHLSKLLEERSMELRIFAIISYLVVLAGMIAYRGEGPRGKGDDALNHLTVPFSLVSLSACLWLNDIRSIDDLLLVFPQWILESRRMELKTLSMTVLMAIFAGIIVWRGDEKPHVRFVDTASSSDQDRLLPPLLIPGRTTHTRLFPEKHSFSYSYLSVGVPVGWAGCASSVLSADVDHLPSSKRQRGWFDISAKDYLSRGSQGCLEHKLSHYLHQEGVSDDEWSFAYLVTAPKFLGYSFNPVSFWYIYDDRKRLTMMILEVNNTFDERRIYLLKADAEPLPEKRDYFPSVEGLRFSNTWKKDFHVSPFNDRKGTYSLIATDPVAALANKSTKPVIDNTITLKTPDGQTKLVARVFSSDVRDASKLTAFEIISFLSRWFWVGFVTFPRIIREAFKLYFIKGLPVFYRPEVLPTSMGRQPTAEETTIETYFRTYLQTLVTQSARPLRIAYHPPAGMGAHHHHHHIHMFVSSGQTAVDEADTPDAVLRVVSPVFYSRFVHYADARQALNHESAAATNDHEENRTVVFENADVLFSLFSEKVGADADAYAGARVKAESHVGGGLLGTVERARWRVLAGLRCPPSEVAYPSSTLSSSSSSSSVSTSSLSDLDLFVQKHCSAQDSKTYRRVLARIFLAERYFAGFTVLVKVADFASRGLVLFAGIVLARGSGRRGGGDGKGNNAEVVAVNVVSIWSLIKGL